MATCGSLRSLFESPLPEKPKSLIESLTWNQAKPKKPIDPCSFTELFGELHFREKPDNDGCPRLDLSELDDNKRRIGDNPSSDPLMGAIKERPKSSGGFSPKSSESLQLCTEGLGSESSDDVEEDVVNGGGDDGKSDHEKEKGGGGGGWVSSYSDVRRSRGRVFPPPISSIGGGGKPWVCFKSFREGGRFVLREIRIPTHEFLRASREDGRLKLHFVCPDMDIQEGEGEGQDEEEEEEIGMEATVQEH